MIHRFSAPDRTDELAPLERPSGDMRSDIERDYPLLQQHDVESLDIAMAQRSVRELVYTSGAQVDLYHRTDNADHDRVQDEDPDPTYWPPVVLKATFTPKALELALKQWGADAPLNLELYFSMADLVSRFGPRVVRVGDVVKIPYNAVGNLTPKYFRVNNATPFGNFKYTWMYMECKIQSMNGDVTTIPRDEGLATADQQDE